MTTFIGRFVRFDHGDCGLRSPIRWEGLTPAGPDVRTTMFAAIPRSSSDGSNRRPRGARRSSARPVGGTLSRGRRPSRSAVSRPVGSTRGTRTGRSTSTLRRRTPPSGVPTRTPLTSVSPFVRLLVLGSLALVGASIVMVSVSGGSFAPFVSALAGYVLAAVADATDRRRCDRLDVSDRLMSAVALRFIALAVAVVCAYFAARAAAL